MSENALTMDQAVHTQYRVEQFYYHEAALLDSGQWEEWNALFEQDTVYRMPVRTNVADVDGGIVDDEGAAFFEETYTDLRQRVRRIRTGRAWAELPNSRTRHLVTNVVIKPAESGELAVNSNFVLYQNRLETETNIFVGQRRDLLRPRPDSGSFGVAKRTIILDQTVLSARALSVLF